MRSYPQYGELSHRQVDDMDQGEGVDGATRKRDPLDFALWKAQKEGEDTAWDAPWGRGRPGWHIECSAMAETLLGVGFDIHGGGSDLVFPHHENEAAQTAAARGAPLTRLWVHNGMVRLEGEKMAKSVGNIFLLHEAIAAHGRDALIAYFCARSLPPADRLLGGAPGGGGAQRRAHPRGRAAAGRAATRRPSLRRCARSSSTRSPRTSTRRERSRRVFDWVREANRRAEAGEPVGDADLREMLGVFALDGCSTPTRPAAGPDAAAQGLLAAREAARAARDFAEADRLRDELAALGWEVRDGAGGPTLVAARLMALRDARPRRRAGSTGWATRPGRVRRNAVHEALRGRARAAGVGDRAGGARAVAARRGGAHRRAREEVERRCGSTDHQGICAEVAPYRYADAASCCAPDDALIVALDEIQDPQNLGAICRTAECAGATGVVIPERRSAEVTPAVCKASAGAVEHLAIARVRNLADFLLDARRRGRVVLRRRRRCARPVHGARLPRQASCSCSARREAACVRASRERATS